MSGYLVRAARQARGLTQRELAELSGVRQSNISAIENGRRAPSAETLSRLLEACGFELTATAGARTLFSPPSPSHRLPDDPPDETPTLGPNASMKERVQVITAVLDAVDATFGR